VRQYLNDGVGFKTIAKGLRGRGIASAAEPVVAVVTTCLLARPEYAKATMFGGQFHRPPKAFPQSMAIARATGTTGITNIEVNRRSIRATDMRECHTPSP
jgi:hypothetical protein